MQKSDKSFFTEAKSVNFNLFSLSTVLSSPFVPQLGYFYLSDVIKTAAKKFRIKPAKIYQENMNTRNLNLIGRNSKKN